MQPKGLLKSRIVWLAIVNFVLALVQYFTGRVVPEGLAEQVVSLDWANIVQALISVAMILARWLIQPRPIEGLV